MYVYKDGRGGLGVYGARPQAQVQALVCGWARAWVEAGVGACDSECVRAVCVCVVCVYVFV